MTDVRHGAEAPRLQQGVFQPGRAQIAREMKCRLNLSSCDEAQMKDGHKRKFSPPNR